MSERDLFLKLLEGRISNARLELREGDTVASMGPPNGSMPTPLPVVAVRVHRPRFFARVLAYGNLGLGEAYMDQDFVMEAGTLQDFLTILLRSRIDRTVHGNLRYLLRLAAIRLRSRLRPKWRSVQRHYDLGDDLFRAFLDPTRTYSCGYAVGENNPATGCWTSGADMVVCWFMPGNTTKFPALESPTVASTLPEPLQRWPRLDWPTGSKCMRWTIGR